MSDTGEDSPRDDGPGDANAFDRSQGANESEHARNPDAPERARNSDANEPHRGTPSVPGDTEPTGLTGWRVVLVLYAVLVAVGGLAGTLVATFVADLSPPELFGFLPLPPTTLGFAVFGAVTVATILGVPLSLVVYVSRRLDL